MKTIQLTEQETKTLTSILEFYLSELRMEIADTERIRMRAPMKGEELFIKDLLGRLRGGE